jgi:hypothetical protein
MAQRTSWFERASPGAAISFVVLDEHRRRQNDVGEGRRRRHELLVHGEEEVLAREASPHPLLVGRDLGRVRVLDEHRSDRRSPGERIGLARQHGTDPRLVEHTDVGVEAVQAVRERRVEAPGPTIPCDEVGAAALALPGARHGR